MTKLLSIEQEFYDYKNEIKFQLDLLNNEQFNHFINLLKQLPNTDVLFDKGQFNFSRLGLDELKILEVFLFEYKYQHNILIDQNYVFKFVMKYIIPNDVSEKIMNNLYGDYSRLTQRIFEHNNIDINVVTDEFFNGETFILPSYINKIKEYILTSNFVIDSIEVHQQIVSIHEQIERSNSSISITTKLDYKELIERYFNGDLYTKLIRYEKPFELFFDAIKHAFGSDKIYLIEIQYLVLIKFIKALDIKLKLNNK